MSQTRCYDDYSMRGARHSRLARGEIIERQADQHPLKKNVTCTGEMEGHLVEFSFLSDLSAILDKGSAGIIIGLHGKSGVTSGKCTLSCLLMHRRGVLELDSTRTVYSFCRRCSCSVGPSAAGARNGKMIRDPSEGLDDHWNSQAILLQIAILSISHVKDLLNKLNII